MKQLILTIVVCILVACLAGCAKPCFYQAGKSIEQCKRDLVECLHSADLTRLYMQGRGYQYVDANKLPQNCERMRIITPLGDYWIADGLCMTVNDHQVISEQEPQESNPKLPAKRRVRYRVLKDASGELLKDASGNFIFVRFFEDTQETGIARSDQIDSK
jgi:hypothetical protein